jgi:hypothetical protein
MLYTRNVSASSAPKSLAPVLPARAALPLAASASALLRGLHAVSRVMATDEAHGQARASFVSLPHVLVLAVFARLPVDARARCAAVCRGWRATVSEPCIWTRLNLSRTSGVRVHVTDAVLRGASGLARGGLTALDVSGCRDVTHDALLAVTTSNAAALTELQMLATGALFGRLTCANAEELLRAAPLLCVLGADVGVTATDALRMLRNEAPFGPLRLRHLKADFRGEEEAGITAEVAAAIATHASLSSVQLSSVRLDVPDALDAVVDAALLRRLSDVTLFCCRLSPASAPALARLLGGSALTKLDIVNVGMQLLDAPAAALLGDALRVNSTLTTLRLHAVHLFADAGAAAALLGALTGHASLRHLTLSYEDAPSEHAVTLIGPALAALVAANTPALKKLSLSFFSLGDAGMRPLLEALPYNTQLNGMMCAGNRMSAAFVRDVLLPAVRANTSLLSLSVDDAGNAMLDAVALVAARRAAAVGAGAAQ